MVDSFTPTSEAHIVPSEVSRHDTARTLIQRISLLRGYQLLPVVVRDKMRDQSSILDEVFSTTRSGPVRYRPLCNYTAWNFGPQFPRWSARPLPEESRVRLTVDLQEELNALQLLALCF
ncbi:hypothetical protein J6590_003791 [Homalodisca vitripennis]|nr:hypothetical protein J6590_003791 [Homalodisca vitripennis]